MFSAAAESLLRQARCSRLSLGAPGGGIRGDPGAATRKNPSGPALETWGTGRPRRPGSERSSSGEGGAGPGRGGA